MTFRSLRTELYDWSGQVIEFHQNFHTYPSRRELKSPLRRRTFCITKDFASDLEVSFTISSILLLKSIINWEEINVLKL